MTRKRKCPDSASNRPTKVSKTSNQTVALENTKLPGDQPTPDLVNHAVLSSFYPKVCTLRVFLLTYLPSTSRVRRRKLSAFGQQDDECILDTCLVGILNEPSGALKQARKVDFITFTQCQQRATGAQSNRTQQCCLNEIVDFAIWSLFRGNFSGQRPRHILCHGLQRASGSVESGHDGKDRGILPGIVRHHPNDNLKILTTSPWTEIISLLGDDAEAIASSLFLDCGIFTRLANGNGNYYQLSGVPISELKNKETSQLGKDLSSRTRDNPNRSASNIRFVRNRILYARPSLNNAGRVKFGLHHTHALQRHAGVAQPDHSVHIAKYIFPRQFGLHNVFTSTVDPTETAHPFKDYTLREMEIRGQRKKSITWIPRRLRGKALELVRKIRRNHHSCSYSQLLRHHCPIGDRPTREYVKPGHEQDISSSEPLVTQIPGTNFSAKPSSTASDHDDNGTSFLPHATPIAAVSAFCRSVIARLLPKDACGIGTEGRQSHAKLMRRIDEFVQMRRFESMTLHKAVQGICVKSIPWLCPPGQNRQKMSNSDHSKRLELLHEFVYYIFDSLLIPLIRATFYVTESSAHRNRLFYFRHDVWRKLCEPSLALLKLNMYSAIKPSQARQKLQSRTMSYSHVRLLPKDHGARPITNLRRRQLKLVSGRRMLGSSINAQLGSLFSVLNYERVRDPTPLGSAMLSVGDLHGRLTQFKAHVPAGSRLFFVKVDIKSCFDSIPQEHLLAMVKSLFSETSYRTTKHTEMKCLDEVGRDDKGLLRRNYIGSARAADDTAVFSNSYADSLAIRKRKVVFADTGNQRVSTRASILKLLHEHVGDSFVKIGKKYMRQTNGIPQGSVLSSLLCSYFYGAFERNELGFLNPESSMLLRLIDDFLLVTMDVQLARRFLEVMVSGDRKYGIAVNADKSLVNFDVSVKGHKVPRLHGGQFFPYCGLGIEMTTLELRKDREKRDAYISNALTVETSSRPGKTLRRKVLASMKLQMHTMLLDMSLNSRKQVISTLLGNFAESAMKMHQYMASMGQATRSRQTLVRKLIEELVLAATKICWVKNNHSRQITRTQMCWIAAAACERVLWRKQSQYKEVLVWLMMLRKSTEDRMNVEKEELRTLVEETDRTFQGYIY
ncbi:Telomerase reverse transcriptase [Exophiala xenobiotica]|nr:Telomerase reverse transcriptase [Exophiala xenobiotica]